MKTKWTLWQKLLLGSAVLNLGLLCWVLFLYLNYDIRGITSGQDQTVAAALEEKMSGKVTNSNDPASKNENKQQAVLSAEEIKEQADKYIGQMELADKVAQLFVITPEALTDYDIVTAAGEESRERFAQYPVGGLIYFSNNLESREQVQTMLSNMQQISRQETGLPLLTCIDEEGGSVVRIADKPAFEVPLVGSMAEIGNSGDPSEAYKVGTTIGKYLSELGFNIDCAPDADVLSNAENTVIGDRSFGADCNLVSQMVVQELKGLAEYGVTGTVKHFPGHGSTAGDSHDGAVSTELTLDEMLQNDLVPFQAAIENGARIVMVGHFAAPNIIGSDIPCSLSSNMVTEVLRERLQYDGLVITDAMNMGAIVNNYDSGTAAAEALKAGVDLLLMPGDFTAAYNGILEAIQSGELSEARIDESLRRIVEFKLGLPEVQKQ